MLDRLGRDGLEQPELRAARKLRHDVEEGPHVRAEGRNARENRFAHGLGQDVRSDREDLVHVEGVPACQCVDGVAVGTPRLGELPNGVDREAGGPSVATRPARTRADPGPHAADGRRRPRRRGRSRPRARESDRSGGRGRAAVQRRLVRPVDVLEDDERWSRQLVEKRECHTRGSAPSSRRPVSAPPVVAAMSANGPNGLGVARLSHEPWSTGQSTRSANARALSSRSRPRRRRTRAGRPRRGKRPARRAARHARAGRSCAHVRARAPGGQLPRHLKDR